LNIGMQAVRPLRCRHILVLGASSQRLSLQTGLTPLTGQPQHQMFKSFSNRVLVCLMSLLNDGLSNI
ncbi:MAG: hypothetical protein ACKPKO_57805, partial [Candidatus Fonsibacter sp.]